MTGPWSFVTGFWTARSPRGPRQSRSPTRTFRRARNYYRSAGAAFNFEAAYEDYGEAARAAPKAPWASEAIFLAANILWNHKHDPDGAAALWKRLGREYPNTKDADAGTLLLSVALQWTDRPEEAKRVLEEFLRKRPESPLADGAREELAELASTLKDNANSASQQGGIAKPQVQKKPN